MIKTKTNRGGPKRWIDASSFVQRTGSSFETANNTVSRVSLYDYILSYLSRQSACAAWSGDLIVDTEIYFPDSMFLTGSNKNRTRKKNIDIWAAVSAIISHASLCNDPSPITGEQYSLAFLKTLYVPLNTDVLETSKPFMISPQKTIRTNPNNATSLKAVIDSYASDILGAY